MSTFTGAVQPGALVGLLTGMYVFMMYMLWSAPAFPSWGTLLACLFSAAFFAALNLLYWPQLVLFQQSNRDRLYNAVLFTLKYFWRVLGAALLQVGYILLYVLFAPWTLALVPFVGLWFILLVCELMLYRPLDEAFQIEKQFVQIEGDPWRETT